MKNHVVYIILLSIVIACQNENKESAMGSKSAVKIVEENKESGVASIKEDNVLSDISITENKIDCDSIWKIWSHRHSQKDSIILRIVNQFESSLPKENFNLLIDLIERKDSLIKFKQPLSAVFKDLSPEPFIISNSQWKKVGEGYKDYFPENYLLEKVDTVKTDTFYFESRKYFKNILNELPEADRQIKVLGLKNTCNALVSVLGMQNGECESYAFYNFDYLNSDSLFTPLISSPYQIEIEFGNWPDIDLLIKENPIHQCTDCPSSYEKARTFAKLKGTTNVFFSFHGPEKDAKESYTPNRSLFYVNKDFEIIQLWSDSIDLFGCSCL